MHELPKPGRITKRLTLEERQHLEALLKGGWGIWPAAKKMGRPGTTIQNEVTINGGRNNYSAASAHANMYKKRSRRAARTPVPLERGLEERLKTLEFAFQSLFEIVKELKQLS